MKPIRTFIRYLKLFGEFCKLNLAAQMEYRINFVSSVLVELGYFIIKAMYVVICYQNDVHIGTLDPNRICIIIGTYVFMTGVYMFVWDAYYLLAERVKTGAIDLIITKPVSSQFMLTLTNVSFGLVFTNMTGGIVLICIGWSGSGIPVTAEGLLGFAFLIVCSSLLTYSLFLIPELLSFKMLSVNGLTTFLGALWDFNNMPMRLYGEAIQIIGMFVFPVFLISNWPGLLIMGELQPLMFVYGAAISVFWFVAVRLMWKKAIRQYASANG